MSTLQCSVLGIVLIGLLGGILPAHAEGPTTAPAASDGKILILPFSSLNKSDTQPWLGRSIQQSVLADLATSAPSRSFAGDAEAADAAAALRAGSDAAAQYVVFGSFVTVGQDVRVTGQLLDVASGQSIAGIKATGRIADIFRIEDQVAAQVRQKLGLAPPLPAVRYPQNAQGPVILERQGQSDQYVPQQPQSPDTYSYPPSGDQYYYNSYYYYPAYGSNYGYDWGWYYPWYGGVILDFDEDDFHHHHDRDGDSHHRFGERGNVGSPGVGVGTLHNGVGTLHNSVGTLNSTGGLRGSAQFNSGSARGSVQFNSRGPAQGGASIHSSGGAVRGGGGGGGHR